MPLVLVHRPVMLVQCGRELMGSVVAGYEIEVLGPDWIQRSLDRVEARASNGAWWQSSDAIGVVRTAHVQVALFQVAIERIESIDDRGIALQRDFPSQTVVEHRRNKVSF